MPPISNGRRSILIVDDEPEIRNILRVVLSDDYDCMAVGSAEEALANLDHQQLVILDIDLRGISGLEILPVVRERSPETIVLVISGLESSKSSLEALRLGAFDYLTKPFSLDQVESAIKRAFAYYDQRAARHHNSSISESQPTLAR